jgi:ELWxxDGT repeat protein
MDLNPNAASSNLGLLVISPDESFALYGGDINTIGRELIKSDGTPSGTTLFLDINPGNNNNSSPGSFHALPTGGWLFKAYTGTLGEELWFTDGISSTNTFLVKDLNSGPNSSSLPYKFTPFGNKYIFSANTASFGPSLWITDGTPSGTVAIKGFKEINFANNTDYVFGVYNNRIYFTAMDEEHGREIWSSDGTTLGTKMILDLTPGKPSTQFPTLEYYQFNSKLFFQAKTPWNGNQLYMVYTE